MGGQQPWLTSSRQTALHMRGEKVWPSRFQQHQQTHLLLLLLLCDTEGTQAGVVSGTGARRAAQIEHSCEHRDGDAVCWCAEQHTAAARLQGCSKAQLRGTALCCTGAAGLQGGPRMMCLEPVTALEAHSTYQSSVWFCTGASRMPHEEWKPTRLLSTAAGHQAGAWGDAAVSGHACML